MDYLHDLFLNGSYFLDPLFDLCSEHWFFFDDLHLLDLFSDIRNDLLNFLDLLLNHWLLFNLDDLLHRGHLLDHLHDFFNRDWNLHHPLHLLLHQHQLLNDLVTGHWHFERNDHGFVNLHNLLYLNCVRHYLFPCDFFGDFYPRLNDLLSHHVNWFYDFLVLDGRHDLLSDDFDLFVNRHFDVFDDLDLHYLLLDDRNLHLLHYLFDLLHFHDPIHDLLDNLRHLNYLLDDPRHHYYLLYDLFHLHHLRNLY